MSPGKSAAVRAVVRGDVHGHGLRDATVARARETGVLGWVRHGEAGEVLVHAEGAPDAVEALVTYLEASPAGTSVDAVETTGARVEGHEQFAVRGVDAGAFVAWEHAGAARRFSLMLEVDGAPRTWALPKGPSMDPAVKRLAVEAADAAPDGATVFDRGGYEQGGRVPWPEALHRGHAVFVLHGETLRGGFALQRTRPGPAPQWLLVKRRDDEARPGSDVVAERS